MQDNLKIKNHLKSNIQKYLHRVKLLSPLLWLLFLILPLSYQFNLIPQKQPFLTVEFSLFLSFPLRLYTSISLIKNRHI